VDGRTGMTIVLRPMDGILVLTIGNILLKHLASECVCADDEVVEEWTMPMFAGESYFMFTQPAITARCVFKLV